MNYLTIRRSFMGSFVGVIIIFDLIWRTVAWSQIEEVESSIANNIEQHILHELADGNDIKSLLPEWRARRRLNPIGGRALQPPHRQTAGALPEVLSALKKSLQRALAKADEAEAMINLQNAYDAFRASDALVRARFDTLASQLNQAQIAPVILVRLQQAKSNYEAISDRLLQIPLSVDKKTDDADQIQTDALKNAVELLADLTTFSAPVLRAELPFRRFNPTSHTPILEPVIEPVYASDISPSSEDLGAGPLTPLSETMLQQAQALNYDPVRIFEFVHNEIDTEWYGGAKYGAEATLVLRRGNDVDQASLLIALLRASQIPARFVHGVVELEIAGIADDLALQDATQVADALIRAGVAYKPVIQGGRITAVQVEYTWVAAHVPYSNYRGALVDFSGPVWLPLAPAIKHYQVAPASAILQHMGFDSQALIDRYISAPQAYEPLQQIRQEVTAYLNGNADYATQLGNKILQPELLQLLPNSLPFNVVAVTAEYQKLPVALQQQVRLSIQASTQADSPVLLEITLPLAQLNQRRITLSYIPASVADHNTVNLFGGLGNTPAYLIELRPQLKIGGQLQKVAESALAVGVEHRLSVELIAPSARVNTSKTLIAGSYYALAIGEGNHSAPIKPDPEAVPDSADSERLAARLLSHIAHSYQHHWWLSEKELADLNGISLIRPLPAVVIVGNSVKVEHALSQPYALAWQGVNLDAALRIVEPLTTNNNADAERDWFRLAGLQGSYLEQQIFQEKFLVDSISADKGLALAQQQGIPLVALDQHNIETQLPLLNLANNVKQALTEAVQAGNTATVARTPITHNVWQGAVWLVQDPDSGGAGYFISGGLAGGETADPPDNWVLDFLAQALAFPYSAEPNTDPTAVTKLEKIQASSELATTVGESLANPLTVRALDRNGRPVAGAKIRFWVTRGGGGLGPSNADRLVAETNAAGLAQVAFRTGTETTLSPIYMKQSASDRYSTQALLNEIEVRADHSSIGTESPFLVVAFPGEPTRLIRSDTPKTEGIAGFWSDTIQAVVYDSFDNPIANVPVTFRATSYDLLTGSLPSNPQNSVFYDTNACPFLFPALGQCGQSSLTQQTSAHGSAGGSLILGNILSTKYHYEISAPGLAPLAYSMNSPSCRACNGESILAITWYPANESGRNINAARMGEASKFPVPLMLLSPSRNVADDSNQAAWRNVRGNVRFYTIREFKQAGDYDGDGSIDDNEQQNIQYHLTEPVYVNGGYYQANIVTRANPIPLISPSHTQYTYVNGNKVQATAIDVGGEELVDYYGGNKMPIAHNVTGLDLQITAAVPGQISLDQTGFSSTPLELSYQILPSNYKGLSVEVDILKDGVPQWQLPGSNRQGSGYVQFPRGLEFDIGADYTAQLIINRGTDLEIHSDSFDIPLRQGIFYDWSRNITLVQDIDLVNQRQCNSGATFRFGLSQQARVSLKFIRVESRAGLLFEGTETVLLDSELYEKGDHELAIVPDALSAGTYRFELHGVATQANQEETVAGGALARLSRRDHLPVGHTLVKGVNLWNGTMSLSREDLNIPGRGPALNLRRTYSSASQADGVLGFGWAHSYASRLLVTSCGEIVIVGGEGGGMRFVDDGQGGLRPLKGYHGSLMANVEDSSFDFYSKDGTRYHYASPTENRWRLEYIEDTNGNLTTLNYEGGQQRLAVVSDAAERSLQFFYRNLYVEIELADDQQTSLWSGDVIDRIQGPDGLDIVFAYDELGRLESVSRREDGEEYWHERYTYADYTDPDSVYDWDDRYLLITATDAIRNASTHYVYKRELLQADFAEDISYSNRFY